MPAFQESEKIDNMVLASGRTGTVIVIESDGEDRVSSSISPVENIDNLSQDALRRLSEMPHSRAWRCCIPNPCETDSFKR